MIWGGGSPPGSNSSRKNKLKLHKIKSFEENELVFGTYVDNYVKKQSVECLHDQSKQGGGIQEIKKIKNRFFSYLYSL